MGALQQEWKAAMSGSIDGIRKFLSKYNHPKTLVVSEEDFWAVINMQPPNSRHLVELGDENCIGFIFWMTTFISKVKDKRPEVLDVSDGVIIDGVEISDKSAASRRHLR